MSDNGRGLEKESFYHMGVNNTPDVRQPYHAMRVAEKFAFEQFELWGLEGWSFRWDYARCRLGSCRYDRKQITLSKHFVSCNPDLEDQIRDTVLHEIAHALAWTNSGEKGHGKLWKDWCLRVGASPRASARGEKLSSLPPRYLLRNKETGEILGKYYRRPRFSRWIKRMMIRGKQETLGKLEIVPFDGDVHL